ncbi:MAG TPA: tetratricopeptide repeat protein, partial [Methanosarcina vacuolata]|nr:tetratricopeptide repeat protein [Methanosarcina vacuolata]
AHCNYGLLLHDMNRMEEAEVQYKLALKADPEDIDTHWNYGVLLEELGRKEEAAMQYLLALEASYDNV